MSELTTECALFKTQPLMITSVANVDVKLVRVDNSYIVGAIAKLPDYLDLLSHSHFDNLDAAYEGFHGVVRQLWDAAHQTPELRVVSNGN